MFQNFKIKIVLIRSILFEFSDLLKYLIIFFLIGIRRTRLEVHQNSDNFLHYITNVVKKKAAINISNLLPSSFQHESTISKTGKTFEMSFINHW